MRIAIAALLAVAAMVLSAVTLSRVSQLSLPLPSALPILNIAIPLLAAIVWSLSQRLSAQLKQNAFRLLLPYLAGASNLAPFTLFTLSLVFAIPSDVQYCATDQYWLRMFEHKDETSIRSIQNRLQCCGLNSIHDRAWPFPSRTSDARACERTQGYHRACGNLWRREEALAAGLTAVSSLLNWIVLVRMHASHRSHTDAFRSYWQVKLLLYQLVVRNLLGLVPSIFLRVKQTRKRGRMMIQTRWSMRQGIKIPQFGTKRLITVIHRHLEILRDSRVS